MGLRTAHIGVIGVLFGGHVFGVRPERILPWLYLAILTGAALMVAELYPNWRACFEVRTIFVFTKLLLVCLVPWFWAYRVFILAAVIVIGSTGSHMPRHFRYYSLLERRVVDAAHPVAPDESLSRS